VALVLSLTPADPAIKTQLGQVICYRQGRGGHAVECINGELSSTVLFAVQCCGSGKFIPDPDFYPSRIPDPKTVTNERGENKLVVIPFFVAINFTKLKIIRITGIELFTQKLSLSSH
jgi:hypothetical protein